MLHNSDLLSQGGQSYTALISRYFSDVQEVRRVARSADVRLDAVQEAWHVYLDLYGLPTQEKNTDNWLLENALGNVYNIVKNERKKHE